MKNQRISGVVIALAAGLVGGLVSRYVAPTVVLAQTQTAPKELRAHNFVLVNDQGNPVGLFGFDPQGKHDHKADCREWTHHLEQRDGTGFGDVSSAGSSSPAPKDSDASADTSKVAH